MDVESDSKSRETKEGLQNSVGGRKMRFGRAKGKGGQSGNGQRIPESRNGEGVPGDEAEAEGEEGMQEETSEEEYGSGEGEYCDATGRQRSST